MGVKGETTLIEHNNWMIFGPIQDCPPAVSWIFYAGFHDINASEA
jgi:hypothetical protein